MTLTGSGKPTLELNLAPGSANQELPNAPAANAPLPQAPTLESLGFTPQQTQANPKLQADSNKRTEMLKIHQRLGLITLAPMAADLITGPMAKAKGRNGQTITEPSNAISTFMPRSAAQQSRSTAPRLTSPSSLPRSPENHEARSHSLP